MLDMLQAGYNGLKVAGDLAQGFFALKSETEKNQAVIDIQRNVLEAQRALMSADGQHTADLKRIEALEQKLAAMEHWEAEKQRYQLSAIDRGAFAYVHKPGMQESEPPMWLCQTCFEKRQKSPLQFREQVIRQSQWGCNLCKSEVVVHYQNSPGKPLPPGVSNSDPPPPSPGMASVKLTRS